MSAYEQYIETLDSYGESILTWADPEGKFRGATEVGRPRSFFRRVDKAISSSWIVGRGEIDFSEIRGPCS